MNKKLLLVVVMFSGQVHAQSAAKPAPAPAKPAPPPSEAAPAPAEDPPTAKASDAPTDESRAKGGFSLHSAPPVHNHAADAVSDGDSLAPIVGYDPTYGVLIGGAYFHGNTENPVTTGSLVVTGTFHRNYAVVAKYKLWTERDWSFAIELGAIHFFDSYFGEGDRTVLSNQLKIQNYKFYGLPEIGYRMDDYSAFTLSGELRYRNEVAVNEDRSRRVFGSEYTPVFDVAYVYDDRDSEGDPKSGRFFQTKLYLGPKGLSTRAGAENFAKLLVELRQFFSLGDFLTLGLHAQAGGSLGEPGYLYRFDLGGSTDMRGYQSSRLRGRHFYEVQTEARVRLTEWLTAVGFVDVGDTADRKLSQFHGARVTKGGGLRFGLPPDYVAKVRLDFGVAPDEKNFYLSFNEAF